MAAFRILTLKIFIQDKHWRPLFRLRVLLTPRPPLRAPLRALSLPLSFPGDGSSRPVFILRSLGAVTDGLKINPAQTLSARPSQPPSSRMQGPGTMATGSGLPHPPQPGGASALCA